MVRRVVCWWRATIGTCLTRKSCFHSAFVCVPLNATQIWTTSARCGSSICVTQPMVSFLFLDLPLSTAKTCMVARKGWGEVPVAAGTSSLVMTSAANLAEGSEKGCVVVDRYGVSHNNKASR